MRAVRILLVLLVASSVPVVTATPAAVGAGSQPDRHLGQDTHPRLRDVARTTEELESRVESLEARVEQLVENLRVRQVSRVRGEERAAQWRAAGLWVLGWIVAAGTLAAWRRSGRRARAYG